MSTAVGSARPACMMRPHIRKAVHHERELDLDAGRARFRDRSAAAGGRNEGAYREQTEASRAGRTGTDAGPHHAPPRPRCVSRIPYPVSRICRALSHIIVPFPPKKKRRGRRRADHSRVRVWCVRVWCVRVPSQLYAHALQRAFASLSVLAAARLLGLCPRCALLRHCSVLAASLLCSCCRPATPVSPCPALPHTLPLCLPSQRHMAADNPSARWSRYLSPDGTTLEYVAAPPPTSPLCAPPVADRASAHAFERTAWSMHGQRMTAGRPRWRPFCRPYRRSRRSSTPDAGAPSSARATRVLTSAATSRPNVRPRLHCALARPHLPRLRTQTAECAPQLGRHTRTGCSSRGPADANMAGVSDES